MSRFQIETISLGGEATRKSKCVQLLYMADFSQLKIPNQSVMFSEKSKNKKLKKRLQIQTVQTTETIHTEMSLIFNHWNPW